MQPTNHRTIVNLSMQQLCLKNYAHSTAVRNPVFWVLTTHSPSARESILRKMMRSGEQEFSDSTCYPARLIAWWSFGWLGGHGRLDIWVAKLISCFLGQLLIQLTVPQW
jgi:hypothetical protein